MAYSTCNLALMVTDVEFPYIFPLDDITGKIEHIAPWFEKIRPLPFGGTREPQQPLEAGTWTDIIAQSLRELNLTDKRLALDPAFPYRWQQELSRELPQLQITSAGDILRNARLIKNEEEQKAIRRACLIGEIGVEAGLSADMDDHVNVLVNGRDVRHLDENFDNLLEDGDQVSIFPALGGG